MKKFLITLFSAVALIFIVNSGALDVSASAATEGYYTYKVSNKEATITDVDTSISGDITIPSTLGGYPVTSIGSYAFYNCTLLTSITIPDSVTSIDKFAFYKCTSLESITIGNSVTSIGSSAFRSCTSLESITIGNSVTSIGESAFESCTSLTSITIPDSVTSIGSSAFESCTSLTSITIPNSVTSIGDDAFYKCTSLESITIPDSVTSIGSYAFYKCTSLESITIPDSVTSIGSYAFYKCTSLESITIPDSVTSIGDSAFSGCDSLEIVAVDDNNSNYCSQDGVLFNKNKTMLIQYPAGKIAMSYAIPNSVTSIGSGAFRGCTSIESITISNSVTSIGDDAFEYCTSLESITIPNSVTSIGDGAFYICNNLKAVYIEDIAAWCNIDFFNSESNPLSRAGKLYLNKQLLKDLVIPAEVKTIKDHTFYRCNSLETIVLSEGVENIGENVFGGNICIKSIKFPQSIRSVGERSFSFSSIDKLNITSVSAWCNIDFSNNYSNPLSSAKSFYLNDKKIENLVIPRDVKNIGNYAFYNCKDIIKVTIHDEVERIGKECFGGCNLIENISVPGSVKEIDDGAFCDCSKLSKITLSEGIERIGTRVFTGTAIKEIIVPESATKLGNDVFSIGDLKSITLPYIRGCECEYCLENPLVSHIIDYHLLDSLIITKQANITKDMFDQSCNIKQIVLPKTLKSIEQSAFDDFDRLTDVWYMGSKADRENIEIGKYNQELLDARWHYNTCLPGSHTYIYACDEYCDNCGWERYDAVEHDVVLAKTTKATLTKNGKKEFRCTVCNMLDYTRTIWKPDVIKLSYTQTTYNGKVKKPTVSAYSLFLEDKITISPENYTLVYESGRKNTGTYSVTVKFKGDYSGSKTLTFRIKPVNVSKCTVKLSNTTYTYNGKVKTPSVIVKNANGTTLKKNTHYTVKYASGRKYVGKYKITITMKGNYSGTKILYLTINPPKTTLKKVTGASKSIKVTVNKKTTQVSGYQIQYSTSKKFTSAKTKTITSAKTTSATIKSLKAKKTYYVRVRTYKTVSGKKYYSGWSTYKSTKTK